MTRGELYVVINEAHDALHSGDVDKAHEVLHNAFQHQPGYVSGTHDPEVIEASRRFDAYCEGGLPCGHRIGDLVYASGSITKCAVCVQIRNQQATNDKE
jgi:hypothetical protein